MARDAYKSEKRRKELERQKKLAEKREKRLHREERSEAEVLADLFGVPYQAAGAQPGEAAEGVSPEAAGEATSAPGEAAAKPEDTSAPEDPADPAKG
jgi:hypothetical protein